jgi:tetratricopeptide (TPR) repeat protein
MRRRIVMGAVIAAIVPAFGLTQLVVNGYRDRRQKLSLEWSARGRSELASRPVSAVEDFETALSYGPDRTSDRFLLAEALVAARRPAEASAQLLALASEDPGNANVNLELARIAASAGVLDDAVRYYHAAIDGVWNSEAMLSRRDARIELARLLMAHGEQVRAQAELIALIDELPPDPALLSGVGSLLVEAGAGARALALFRRALAIDPANARAARLAGETEFRSGDIRSARRDLMAAADHGGLDDETRGLLDVSERVLALDPFVDRLRVQTRAQRAARAVAIAGARLERCRQAWTADANVAPTLDSLTGRLTAAAGLRLQSLERDPDLIDDSAGVALEIEKLPSGACGAGTPDDRALAVIASQHGAQPQ